MRSQARSGPSLEPPHAIAAGAAVYVQPTVAFVYPPDGPVSEDTPVRHLQQ